MNIQTMSAYQRGAFNDQTNRYEGMNHYPEYVRFCMGRRSYKSKQGKGLTRSVIGVDKQVRKSGEYHEKLIRRLPTFTDHLVGVITDVANEVLLDQAKETRHSGLLQKIFSRKAAPAE